MPLFDWGFGKNDIVINKETGEYVKVKEIEGGTVRGKRYDADEGRPTEEYREGFGSIFSLFRKAK